MCLYTPLHAPQVSSPYWDHWEAYSLARYSLQNNCPCLGHCQAQAFFSQRGTGQHAVITYSAELLRRFSEAGTWCRGWDVVQSRHSLRLPLRPSLPLPASLAFHPCPTL